MGWLERTTAIFAGVAVIASLSVIVARSEASSELSGSAVAVFTPSPPARTLPPPPPATKAPAPEPPAVATSVGAITTTGVVTVRAKAMFASKPVQLLTPGVLLPVYERRGEFFKVFTPHEAFGWVHRSKAKRHEKAGARPKGSLEGATVVIDPGHGGHLSGAIGPGGLTEKQVNLSISRSLVDEISQARVFLTRGEGHAGLAYRSALANRLGAHIFLSVHNNALPDAKSKLPGSETYYQQHSANSKRLAGLVYEELHGAFASFKILWGKDPFAGAKYRRNGEGHDYYAVLRRTLVPAVISEGMFITNKAEELLLRNASVRELYAEALGRAIKRYFTTDDPGSGYKDPYAVPHPECKIEGCFEHRK